MENSKKKEGVVINLAERVKRGEILPKEAREEFYKMGLHHGDYETKYKKVMIPTGLIGFFLILIPFLAKLMGFSALNSFIDLSFIVFHPAFLVIMAVLLIFLIIMGCHAAYLRRIKGGTKDGDEPIIHIKSGPYAIMRHPTVGLLAIIPLWFSMIFSIAMVVPYTVISIMGNILIFVAIYFDTKGEEEFNIIKWGVNYKKYQKAVPRFNFLIGIVKWVKRKSN